MKDTKSPFEIKRIYEEADSGDGRRVLVDRIWPRGVSKEKAKLADWMKEVAPSAELRTWFGHDPDKFDRFADMYRDELAGPDARPHLEQLKRWAGDGHVTLLYAARDEQCNHAVVLKEYLERRR